MNQLNTPWGESGKEIHPDFQDLYDSLYNLYYVGQLEGAINGVEVARQGNVSSFDTPGRRVGIWRDEETAELHAAVTCTPLPVNGYQRLRQIEKTCMFSIRADGTPGTHMQNWGGVSDLDMHDKGFEILRDVLVDLETARDATLMEVHLRAALPKGIGARVGRFISKVL
jgi:hypothetical protein